MPTSAKACLPPDFGRQRPIFAGHTRDGTEFVVSQSVDHPGLLHLHTDAWQSRLCLSRVVEQAHAAATAHERHQP